jgi:hypothetical protein
MQQVYLSHKSTQKHTISNIIFPPLSPGVYQHHLESEAPAVT